MRTISLKFARYVLKSFPLKDQGWIATAMFNFAQNINSTHLAFPEDGRGIFVCMEPVSTDRAVIRGALRHYRGEDAWIVSHLFVDPEIARSAEFGLANRILDGLIDELRSKLANSPFSTKDWPILIRIPQQQAAVKIWIYKRQEEGRLRDLGDGRHLIYVPPRLPLAFAPRRCVLNELGQL